MKKFALLALMLLTQSMAALAQNFHWETVTDWDQYLEQEDLRHPTQYALYDVDSDGTPEAFVTDGEGCYALLTAGGKGVECVMSTAMNTYLLIIKGRPYVAHRGGCGTGCYMEQFSKIERSRSTMLISNISLFGMDDSEEHECTMFSGGQLKDITYEQFERLSPKSDNGLEMSALDWRPISGGKVTAHDAVETTLHYEAPDTVIVRDAKGYFYQLSPRYGTASVAPGGAYTGDVVIPPHIRYDGADYRVTIVRRGAMWRKPGASNIGNITSITLPETVGLIGADAFRDNASLASFSCAKTARIEVRSFWGCPKLQLKGIAPGFGYTSPFYFNDEGSAKELHLDYYIPIEHPSAELENYSWVFCKYNHGGIKFEEWMNYKNQRAMPCWCHNLNLVQCAHYSLMDPSNEASIFKGYLDSPQEIVLLDNAYVGTHEFPAFSRWTTDEVEKEMPKAFVQSLEKKYGRHAKYSYQVGALLYSTKEELAITEFDVTNHEAMFVLSWLKDGKEVSSYVRRQPTESEYEEWGVWNVDDDGTYGIPNLLTIARAEDGSLELLLAHYAPESTTFLHFRQEGKNLVLISDDGYYVWIDPPTDEEGNQ